MLSSLIFILSFAISIPILIIADSSLDSSGLIAEKGSDSDLNSDSNALAFRPEDNPDTLTGTTGLNIPLDYSQAEPMINTNTGCVDNGIQKRGQGACPSNQSPTPSRQEGSTGDSTESTTDRYNPCPKPVPYHVTCGGPMSGQNRQFLFKVMNCKNRQSS